VRVLTELYIIFEYTNISFTEKQKEDYGKLYDLLYSSDIISSVLKEIPQEELNILFNGVTDTLKAIYEYQNSAFGLIEGLREIKDVPEMDVTALNDLIKNFDQNPTIQSLFSLLDLNG